VYQPVKINPKVLLPLCVRGTPLSGADIHVQGRDSSRPFFAALTSYVSYSPRTAKIRATRHYKLFSKCSHIGKETAKKGGGGKKNMLHWSLVFLVIALIAAVFGFAGIAGTAAGIAKILFVVFLVVWLLAFAFGRRSV
jgi:uncharacterized membrane protein YtjA (UPF0391 family)